METGEKWNAVITSDPSYDGSFFYGVKSTGVFCRPSCASKAPRRENVVFFDTAEDAARAGFRPCKRCRPELAAYDPGAELAEAAKALIDRGFAEREELKSRLGSLGVTRRHLTELFEKRYDMSPEQYAAKVRLEKAEELLAAGVRVTDAAFSVGMESSASFAAFFKKQTGMAPSEYAKRRMEEHPRCVCDTPAGAVRIEEDGQGITLLRFLTDGQTPGALTEKGRYLADAKAQLGEYFTRRRTAFDLPLSVRGTEFQQKVWRALQSIPYGETWSYQRLAEAVGNGKAARAVGMANNRNPINIIIPCHRVVGKNGQLVGYAGGIERKRYLLELEASH